MIISTPSTVILFSLMYLPEKLCKLNLPLIKISLSFNYNYIIGKKKVRADSYQEVNDPLE